MAASYSGAARLGAFFAITALSAVAQPSWLPWPKRAAKSITNFGAPQAFAVSLPTSEPSKVKSKRPFQLYEGDATPARADARCTSRLVLGVDYYPEQWPLQDMHADIRAIKDDLGADLIRIGEFMWHDIEPKPYQFNFTLLDTVIKAAEEAGLEVMLGTPTATFPAWLYKMHPNIVSKMPDSPEGYAGASNSFGGRRQYSYTSPEYIRHARRLVEKLADRYGQRKSITFWQVDNELGHEGSDLDFSESSLSAWRVWLELKFKGSIDKLNEDWGTVFWGVTYNSFDEIGLPLFTVPGGQLSSNENFRSNQNPGMLLDFRRYRRDAITAFANIQVDILRSKGVLGCVTTNSPGGTWAKTLDYNDIFTKMDIPAYDNYPVWGGSLQPDSASMVAMKLDTVRGWGMMSTGQTGWMVAEQLIGAQGHDIIGFTPRPGQVRAWAAASFLHGAVSVSFFRYRAAVFGQEQFCYGILDHTTPRGTGRKWKEAKSLYEFARTHEDLWLTPMTADIAVLYDTDNIFAWQGQPQSNAFEFEPELHRLYYPFWRNGAAIDVISVRHLLDNYQAEYGSSESPTSAAGRLLSKYRVLVLPALMLTDDRLPPVLEHFVQNGGSLWVGYRSDLKDGRSQIRRTPSRLATLAGVEVAEFESLNLGSKKSTLTAAGDDDSTRWNDASGEWPRKNDNRRSRTAGASVWREGLRILQQPQRDQETKMTTKPLWEYTDSFFGREGYAAVTRRSGGDKGGEVIYIGTGIEQEALVPLAAASIKRQGLRVAGVSENPNVEQALRKDRKGNVWHVVINHDEVDTLVEGAGSKRLSPFEISINPLDASIIL